MWSWLKDVDRILRGEATRVADVRGGEVPIPALGVSVVVVLLGMVYGFFMGWFALINREPAVYWQVVATTVKVPALFALTLLVTFPSLYVFNVLVGSRLRVTAVFKLLLAGLAVALSVLASFGPITAFFSITSESYPFMVLLNVVLFAVAGSLGLMFLLRTLHRMTIADQLLRRPITPPAKSNQVDAGEHPGAAGQSAGGAAQNPGESGSSGQSPPSAGQTPSDSAGGQSSSGQPGGLDNGNANGGWPPWEDELENGGPLAPLEGHVLGRNVKAVFYCWVLIFALVGAQMSWVLRPFIGNPNMPFQWFRQRESNFFEAVFATLQSLFS